MARKRKYQTPCGKSESFILICHSMFSSAAYRDLSPVARALLNEFLDIYRPDRNGYLSIDVRTAMQRVKAGQDAIMTAFNDLQSHGFIQLRMHSSYTMKQAREWILTFREAYGKPATNEWKKWDPIKPFEVKSKKRKKRKQKKITTHPNTTKSRVLKYSDEQKFVRKICEVEEPIT